MYSRLNLRNKMLPLQLKLFLIDLPSSKEETGARKHLFTDVKTTHSGPLKGHPVNHVSGESIDNTPFHKLQKINRSKIQS